MNYSVVRLEADEPVPNDLSIYLKLGSPETRATGGENQDAPRKRRKIEAQQANTADERGPDAITLARIDMNLTFHQHEGFARPSRAPPSAEVTGLGRPVLLSGFDEHKSSLPRSSTATLHLSTLDKSPICKITLHGQFDDKQATILRHAMALSKPSRYVTSRSSFIITLDPPSPSAASILSMRITSRLLVPNARSLLENPGRPSGPDFLDLFGPTSLGDGRPWSTKEFYDNVYVPDRREYPSLAPIEGLQCALYPFQKRAVQWLLGREGFLIRDGPEKPRGFLHGFYQAQDADGRKCFFSRLFGLATTDMGLLRESRHAFTGGILAEEMGLGKTVEVVALICANRFHAEQASCSQESVIRSPATLIITPPAILQQWKDEIRTLAPDLKVTTYDGMRIEASQNDDAELIRKCLSNDVVLTTYSTIARDIHYSEAPVKNLRHVKRYKKRLSPLTQTLWWRVVLDEAQMVESGVSNAAKVASLIPRQHAWCVSGTPAKSAKDLLGLLTFLHYRPYSEMPTIWRRLVGQHRDLLGELFKGITLRHTKAQIRDDVELPLQKRIVITTPFTPVEEQHYSGLFQQMADDCAFDLDGGPLREDWDPEDPHTIETMRTWLARLRQTCLHPEVGSRNRKALGSSKGPLRTVAEVLEVMIEQNELSTRTEQRNILLSQIRRGQIHEHAEQSQSALKIWQQTLEEARIIVQESRRQLQVELDRLAKSESIATSKTEQEAHSMARTGPHRQRLRAAIEIEHVCLFFIANAYFQLKSQEVARQEEVNHDNDGNDLLEKPMSDVTKDLESQEELFYDLAKGLRRELLVESREKVDATVNKIKQRQGSMVHIPAIGSIKDHGGIQAQALYERVTRLLASVQGQANHIILWRSKAIELLTLSLVDEDDSDVQGNEYEMSTKQQDEVYVYVDAFRALVSDRHDVLTGQENQLINHEMKLILKEAKEGRGHSPQLTVQLLEQRRTLKPEKAWGSVRGLISELRELKTRLRGSVEHSNARAAAESLIVNSILQRLHQINLEQSKVTSALDKEVELLKEAMNLRLDYYRQLQAISDTVAPFEEEMDDETREEALTKKMESEDRMRARLTTLKSKGRYLEHIRVEASDTQSQRTCIICTSTFETGVLTSCGHTFCPDCLRLWWGQHRNCPTCKQHLKASRDFHPISFKSTTIEEEEVDTPDSVAKTTESKSSVIYAGVQESILTQIKDIDLDGSFGTKIDSLARHLLWIRQHDAGAKSVVFSQYRDFLEVLGRAFSQFKISYTGIDKKDGIQKFKNDESVDCFFLHAKSQSQGLNLVNATHVILCEPLINTAIELQAIARVHRIGQHHETTVWMYLVEGTVEKSIYNISVQRRLAQLGQVQQAKANGHGDQAVENQMDAANNLEIEQTPMSSVLTKGSSGGELVKNEDLWKCLFSSRLKRADEVSRHVPIEVAHHLGAEAAEGRQE